MHPLPDHPRTGMVSFSEIVHIFIDYLLPIPTYEQLGLAEPFVPVYELTHEEAYKVAGLSILNDLLYTHQIMMLL